MAWTLSASGTLEDRPRYSKSRCFDPLPDCSEALKAKIRAVAEDLGAHRKARQSDHPGLTLTQMDNVLETLRAGEPLDADGQHASRIKGFTTDSIIDVATIVQMKAFHIDFWRGETVMLRNTFSLIAGFLLGSTAASAATPPASEMPLQSRIEVAQKTIDRLIGAQPSSTTKTDSPKVAQHHWNDHHWKKWGDHHHD